MGKIIGESFDPYVNAQVDIRQSKLGKLIGIMNYLHTLHLKHPG